MTPRVRPPRMPNHRSLAALLAATAALAACSPDQPVVPETARPAHVILATGAAGGLVPLASLGDTATVLARVVDASGHPVPDARLQWSLHPAGVVAQDGEGVYRAVGNGSVTVVAEVVVGETGVRAGGYYARPLADSVVLRVQQRPERLTIAPVDTAFGTLGASRQLRAEVTDARGNAMLGGPPALTWASADPRVLTVDGSGMLRSLAEGASRVSVHAAGLVGAATFTVQPRLPHTSCMVFAQRKQTRQACVTLDLVMREPGAGR